MSVFAQQVMNEFVKDIETAKNYDLSKSYPDLNVFVGTADQITFLSVLPDGLRMVRYYAVDPFTDSSYKKLFNLIKKSKAVKNIYFLMLLGGFFFFYFFFLLIFFFFFF